MMKLIFNGVLIAAAVAIVFIYIKPAYENPTNGIKILKENKETLLKARSDLSNLKEKQKALLAQRNAFPQQELDSLERLLPKEINPVLFVMELDNLARGNGMSLKNIKFEDTRITNPTVVADPAAPQKEYMTINMSFDVVGTYEGFTNFIRLIENGLRITNVTSITLVANEKLDFNQYTVRVQTYYLK